MTVQDICATNAKPTVKPVFNPILLNVHSVLQVIDCSIIHSALLVKSNHAKTAIILIQIKLQSVNSVKKDFGSKIINVSTVKKDVGFAHLKLYALNAKTDGLLTQKQISVFLVFKAVPSAHKPIFPTVWCAFQAVTFQSNS